VPLLGPLLPGLGEPNLLRGFEDVHSCAEHAAALLTLLLSVEVDPNHLSELLGFISPHSFKPSVWVSLTLIQTSAIRDIAGPVLHRELHRQVARQWFGFEVIEPSDLLQELKESSIAAHVELSSLRDREAKRERVSEPVVAKRSRKITNIEKAIDSQNAQLQLAIKCKAAFCRMPSTMAEAVNIFAGAGYMETASAVSALNSIVSDWTLTKHALVLDQALDRVLANEIEMGRGKTFFGVGISSDESPPEGSRFCSFRFQVTQVYIPWVPCCTTWGDAEWRSKPPLRVQQRQVDIVHCPNKDGKAVARAVGLQLQALGLTLGDVHSGTGDGGGEMEGGAGLHRAIEEMNPTYVRRRCWAHLSWRCVDYGVQVFEAFATFASMLNYLRDSGTWLRLQAIAVQPAHQGGLAMTTEGSALFKMVFGVAPPAIVDGRPESISIALKWLLPKETTLARLAVRDIEQRGLGADIKEAVASMTNLRDRVFRRLNLDMVERGLFMFYFSKKAKHILPDYSFDEIVEKAIGVLTDSAIDDNFLKRHCITDEFLMQRGWLEHSCVQVLALLGTEEDEAAAEALMPEAAEYHLRVLSRMASHVQLNAANIGRSTWLFGQLLSTRPAVAREAASKLCEHFQRTREELRAPQLIGRSMIVVNRIYFLALRGFASGHRLAMLRGFASGHRLAKLRGFASGHRLAKLRGFASGHRLAKPKGFT